jgi:hypothetical protein
LCYQFKPIDDKAKVKDTLAIGIPTLSTTKLTNTFLNQIICATRRLPMLMVTRTHAAAVYIFISNLFSTLLFASVGSNREILDESQQGRELQSRCDDGTYAPEVCGALVLSSSSIRFRYLKQVPSAAGAPKAKRVAKRKLDEVDEEAGPSEKPEPEMVVPSGKSPILAISLQMLTSPQAKTSNLALTTNRPCFPITAAPTSTILKPN